MKCIERFKSIQGEGKYSGWPTYFVRLCGCNLRCGFGCECQQDYDDLLGHWENQSNGAKTSLKEYPLLKRGCDSYPAIIPEIYNELNDVKNLTEADWIEIFRDEDNICITGGEPLLHQIELLDIFRKINPVRNNITFETNGSVLIHENLLDWNHLKENIGLANFTFSISPKIGIVGGYNEIHLKNLQQNIYNLLEHDQDFYLKFVFEKDNDLLGDIKQIGALSVSKKHIYIMAEGSTNSEQFQENCKNAAEFCIENDFIYTDRLQNRIWKNEWSR
jgi:6-pyruvoyltetrahydropterin 2'-reductase